MPSKPPTDIPIRTEVPWSEGTTDYDRAHLTTYLRLLDAVDDNASLDEIARLILGIDPVLEPDRARTAVANHVRRARWMAVNSALLADQSGPRRKS